jgi:hypothetical protein
MKKILSLGLSRILEGELNISIEKPTWGTFFIQFIKI